jgi:hypothetical protein
MHEQHYIILRRSSMTTRILSGVPLSLAAGRAARNNFAKQLY